MRAPIHSVKHYTQRSLLTVAAGATENFIIARGNSNPDAAVATEIQEGALLKAVFVEMWVRTNDTSPGAVLISLIKVPGIGPLPTFAQMVALQTYDNKKNIFYHTQGLTNDQDADAVPFVRGWFKIPKGKQRFGRDDILVLSISAQALAQNICGFSTFKEYT